MGNSNLERTSNPAGDNSDDRWYAGFDDEQFVRTAEDSWYVESREGVFGPFQSLKDAEGFYYKRFSVKAVAK
jgi:hypothetical protein